jgi:hypothetical protein
MDDDHGLSELAPIPSEGGETACLEQLPCGDAKSIVSQTATVRGSVNGSELEGAAVIPAVLCL